MALPALLEVVPPPAPIRASVSVPGSKSETNRALILAALGEGEFTLHGALWSDDTQVMVECLRTLGVGVTITPDPTEPDNRTLVVQGCGGRLAPGGTEDSPVELYVGNAGTAARFLVALVCLGSGAYRLSGTKRMHERPQGALFDALGQLGYRIDAEDGHLPAVVRGAGPRPGQCTVSIRDSSQFASALLLGARVGGWEVEVIDANADESPYVTMTEQMIPIYTQPGVHQIEGDASSASYLVGADLMARLRGGDAESVTVTNWPHSGWQFDERFERFCAAALAEQVPPLVSRNTDLGDSIMTAIVIAPLLSRPVRFVGLDRLRVQECDRVQALYEGLTLCGARVEMEGDDLVIHPSALHGAEIETFEDHRVAMCFAMLGLFVPGILIRNPACVSKTFPDFFRKLATPMPHGLGATLRDPSDGHVLTEGELAD
ncbi:MAG: hypothetical protein O2798_00580 [Chloroflexi bacterium]|nr:hypothetical protein [Chloroflexota bacterium]MDA1239318.1 hypothetical protein [Chloroflexota bacterium]